jgi:hypothetical protein
LHSAHIGVTHSKPPSACHTSFPSTTTYNDLTPLSAIFPDAVKMRHPFPQLLYVVKSIIDKISNLEVETPIVTEGSSRSKIQQLFLKTDLERSPAIQFQKSERKRASTILPPIDIVALFRPD